MKHLLHFSRKSRQGTGPLGLSQLSSSLPTSSLSLFLSSLPALWPGLWVPLTPPSFHRQPVENQIANLANLKS